MRLWFDGQCFQTGSSRRGIGRYAIELIKAIAQDHPDIELQLSFNAAMPLEAVAARGVVSQWVRPENIHVWHSAKDPGEVFVGHSDMRRLSEIALEYHVEQLRPDFAISTSPFEGTGDPAVPLLKSAGGSVPVASIFYDAIPWRFSSLYLSSVAHSAHYKRRLEAHRNFDLHLCISEFSQRELHDIVGPVPSANIYAGISDSFKNHVPQAPTGSAPADPYILYVGALDWRKNVPLLPSAFARLPELLRARYRLVVAGDYTDGQLSEVVDRWRQHRLPEQSLVCHRHVSESDLIALYLGASVLVQPSLMEGFGLTALEAMYCGTPVAAARAGALPEVVGDDRLMFDPTSADQLATVLQRILTDDALRAETIAASKARAERFNWARTADLAIAAIRQRMRDLASPGPKLAPESVAALVAGSGIDVGTFANTMALATPNTAPGRLIVDATSTLEIDHQTGIQRVVKNTTRHLVPPQKEQSGPHRLLSFCDGPDGWFDAGTVLNGVPDKHPSRRLRPGPRDRILMLDSSWLYHKAQQEFFLAARLRGAEIYSCLYDLVPIKMPAFCVPLLPRAFSDWLTTALSYSTGFVCISRAVADELLALLRAIDYPHRMKVGYWRLGADFAAGPDPGPAARSPPQNRPPVFLMVGTLEPRKGHRVALDAFEQLWADGSDAHLTLAGKAGWGVDELLERIRSSREFGKRLFWHDKIDDAGLIELYATSDALIAASHAEGFGLPLVEAAHFGKHIIASDIPVFREVGGGVGATFFEAGSAAALREALDDHMAARSDGQVSKTAVSEAWPGWAQSTAELERVVLGDAWYAVHEPREGPSYRPLTDIGLKPMAREFKPDERQFSVTLIDGVSRPAEGDAFHVTVAIANLSKNLWSSTGAADGKFAVAATCRVRDDTLGAWADDPARSYLPFILAPGETVIVKVALPEGVRPGQGRAVKITLIQEGCALWEGGIEITV